MYGQDDWSVGQDDIYQPDLSDKPKKKMKSRFWAIVGSGLLFGLCAGVMIWGVGQFMPKFSGTGSDDLGAATSAEISDNTDAVQEASTVGNTAEADPVDTALSDLQQGTDIAVTQTGSETKAVVTDVTDVVDTVMPSVVSIFGTYAVTENFWGYAVKQEETGSGSGIIVGENEEELLLVTNNHVVADSTSLSVQFIDESTYDAVVKGTDADADLAVIAIKLSGLSTATKSAIRIATLGDSDTLKVGEPAIAIGNALGYGQSVTTGVISALNRDYSVDEDGNTQALIQTDAAINPGNSGGALLDVNGEVIGINSNKIAGTKVEGMGYAIPISTAKPIIAELMNKQTRTPVEQNKRGYLGISGLNVDSQVQEMYGIPVGVYISRVYEGTAAQKAGLKKGDIIISCDGETVETMEGLSTLLDSMEAGTSVQIGVMMSVDGGYQERILEVTLDGNQ
ncbi:MAG: trypsin-like peptidase domain-containing protein [Firmicutes bacterium]|nr:trypsin-like peptidase domain-containing protein [Bacillota bacterium]MDD6695443.1 trypsin-like peptidase domain-containing protein [Bacillota bacterium]